MVRERAYDKTPEVVDPVTGKPISESKLNSLVVGPEVEPEEMGDDITGPEDLPEARVREREGTQSIVRVDTDDMKGTLDRARDAWRSMRAARGLD